MNIKYLTLLFLLINTSSCVIDFKTRKDNLVLDITEYDDAFLINICTNSILSIQAEEINYYSSNDTMYVEIPKLAYYLSIDGLPSDPKLGLVECLRLDLDTTINYINLLHGNIIIIDSLKRERIHYRLG